MSEILVNHEAVISEAKVIEEAAQFFSYKTLHNVDIRTTLVANERGKTTYDNSQRAVSSLRSGIEKEVKNIREMDQEYLRFDNASATKISTEISN